MTHDDATGARLPLPGSGIQVAEFGAEFVVFDPRCMQVYLIGGIEAVVFDACAAGLSEPDLARELAETLSMSTGEAHGHVQRCLATLTDLGVVGDNPARSKPP